MKRGNYIDLEIKPEVTVLVYFFKTNTVALAYAFRPVIKISL